MMDIVISLDTEDYLTAESADAEKWWAEELYSRGIRASFQVVGEVVRHLRRNGRLDVLQAIGHHEIGYHSNYHSRPPVQAAAIEGMALDRGMEWIFRSEAEGIATLVEQFGRMPISYCQPGTSWTPQTLLAMAAMGIAVCADAPFPLKPAAPCWYCGLLNMQYHIEIDSVYQSEDEDCIGEFKARFESVAKALPADGVMVVYTHPTRLYTSRFWDLVFASSEDVGADSFRPAPLWPAEKTRRLKDRVRLLLDWLSALPDVRFIDYSRVYAERPVGRRTLRMLLDECGLKPGEEGFLPLREPLSPTFISKEDVLAYKYDWDILPRGFKGESLLEQARKLLWTSGPAEKIT